MSRVLHRIFPIVERLSAAMALRFTPAGRLLAVLLLGAAIFGADPHETHAYRLAALLTACFAVAVFGARRARPRVVIHRELPPRLTAREAAGYYLRVTNAGADIEHGLRLTDELAALVPMLAGFDLGSDDDPSQNWFDRRIGFLRWREHMKRACGAAVEPQIVSVLRPGETARIFVPLTPLRRGRLAFTRVSVARAEPLGLLRGVARLRLPDTLIAVPPRHPVPPLALGMDRHRLGRRPLVRTAGGGEEFFGLRDYRPGDPERYIHWRSFAKRALPVVKQFADPQRERRSLVIDCHQRVPDESRFEAVLSVAASLATMPRHAETDLDLLIAGAALAPLRAGFGGETLAALACLPIVQEDGWAAVDAWLRSPAGEAARFLITSTWDEARARALGALAAARPGFRVLLVAGSDAPAPSAPWLVVLNPKRLGTGLAALGDPAGVRPA